MTKVAFELSVLERYENASPVVVVLDDGIPAQPGEDTVAKRFGSRMERNRLARGCSTAAASLYRKVVVCGGGSFGYRLNPQCTSS